MSTRCNVIIKNAKGMTQLYHHHDGYPEGVGNDLCNYMRVLETQVDGDAIEDFLKDTNNLADFLCDEKWHDEYEKENKINLHGDIEYLYIIDTDEQTINCYETDMWDYKGNYEEMINNIDDEKNKEYAKLVYIASMWDRWEDIEEDINTRNENGNN